MLNYNQRARPQPFTYHYDQTVYHSQTQIVSYTEESQPLLHCGPGWDLALNFLVFTHKYNPILLHHWPTQFIWMGLGLEKPQRISN